MKKLILSVLLACFTITGTYAAPPRIIKSKQTYNGLNGAGAWLMIAGGSLFVGGIAKAIGNGMVAPDPKDYSSTEAYIKHHNEYIRNQDFCNYTFAATIGTTGLCFVFAGADMFFAARNLKLNETTTMRIKSDKNGIGLCLNFH